MVNVDKKSKSMFSPVLLGVMACNKNETVWSREGRAYLVTAEKAGLVKVTKGQSKYDSTFELTTSGQALLDTVTHSMVAGADFVAVNPNDFARVALWFFTLTRGAVYSYYGNSAWGNAGERLHVLDCGVNVDASETPKDNYWDSFQGTFYEGDTSRRGLSGEATCWCGLVEGLKVVYESDGGLANLIIDLTTPGPAKFV